MKNEKKFEFKYDGENFIDLNTLLTSQFHFLAAVNELQKELYPSVDLKIKVGAFNKGSFIVDLLMESSWVDSLFNKENAVIVSTIVSTFSHLINVHKFLKGRKADKIEEVGNNITLTINGDNNKITISKDVFNIYKENTTINKAIQQNFELLKDDAEIQGVQISESESSDKQVFLKIEKEEFKDLSTPNPYLERDVHEEIYARQNLFIKKPNLVPEKNRVWNWEFIYKGADIKAKITDRSLEKKINEGLRVGQGDRIIADLKIFYKFSKTYNTFIQSGKYEVVKIHGFATREEQQSLVYELPRIFQTKH